jgi:ankyrin repeat protein
MSPHHIHHFVGDFQTPLHYAANNGLTEVSQLLIGHGADINMKDVSNMMDGSDCD